MGGLFKVKTPQVSQAQQEAQQAQTEQIRREEERQQQEEEAQAAARRARTGRNAGRALLLDDELGVTGADGRPLSTKLGS